MYSTVLHERTSIMAYKLYVLTELKLLLVVKN